MDHTRREHPALDMEHLQGDRIVLRIEPFVILRVGSKFLIPFVEFTKFGLERNLALIFRLRQEAINWSASCVADTVFILHQKRLIGCWPFVPKSQQSVSAFGEL